MPILLLRSAASYACTTLFCWGKIHRLRLRESSNSISGTTPPVARNLATAVLLFRPSRRYSLSRSMRLRRRNSGCGCHAQYMKKAYLRSHRESRSV